MADHPYMPLWTDAYLGDTRHLSQPEHGAYLLLLMTAWRSPDCSLPDDDKLLARYAGCDLRTWKRQRPVVLEGFFTQRSDGRWTQKRQIKERKHVEHVSNIRAAAAKSKHQKNNETPPANGGANGGAKYPYPHPQEEKKESPPLIPPEGGDADKPPPKSKSKRVAVLADLQVDDEMRALGREHGKDADKQLPQFLDWLKAKGKRQRDYRAGFRNWLRSPYGKDIPAKPPDKGRFGEGRELLREHLREYGLDWDDDDELQSAGSGKMLIHAPSGHRH